MSASAALDVAGPDELSVATSTMGDVPSLSSGPVGGPVGSALVGRLDELTGLLRTMGVDGDQTAHAVLLAGDAGVGKTRLLTELRDRCFAAGWEVYAGHCLDFDAGLPYLPFSEIVGRIVAGEPEVFDAVAAEHPALNRLRPGRRMLHDAEAASGSAGDSTDRGPLYDAVHALLDQLAVDRPVLIVVEDAHWADASTRHLLSFLFARPFAHHVAIVASYRSDDLHRRHPLRRVVAEWARIPGVVRLQLDPLTAPDVRTLIAQLDGGEESAPLSGAAVERIVERAEGNAFFVEELVGATGAGSDLPADLPVDLADLLLVRLDSLDEAGTSVVRTAAVAGRRVRHDLLGAVSELPATALDDGLRDAVEHHVLVLDRDGFAFRHALLAEAVYDDLLPGERARSHAAYAAALGDRRASGTAAELARHALLAGDHETALGATVRAGEEAMAVGGPVEAARHFESALDLLGRHGGADGLDPADLAARAGDALVAAGNSPRAVALLRDLLERLPEDAPVAQRSVLRAALASAIVHAETTLNPLEYTTPALEELPAEPSLLRARLLHLHAQALFHVWDLEDARRVAAEALAMTEELELPRLGSDIVNTLASIDRVDPDLSAGEVEEALDLAVRSAAGSGASSAHLRALWQRGRWHFDRAEYAAAFEAYRRTTDVAMRLGAMWAPYAFDARFSNVQIAYLVGEWDDAVALADMSGQSPPPLPEAILTAMLLPVRSARGDLTALRDAERIRPRWTDEGIIAVAAAPAAIDLHAHVGDRGAVLATHDDVVATLSGLWRTFPGRIRIGAITIGALATGIDTAPADVRRTVSAQVAEIYEGATRTSRSRYTSSGTWGPEGEAWDGRLEAERLRFAWLAGIEAPDARDLVIAWRADAERFEALGHVFEAARSQTRLAQVLHAAGDAEATTYAERARQTAERLGALPLLEEVRAIVPSSRPARGGSQELTPREREILALVAAGRSNGEIGKQLFIATKTASVHVSNILAKLGASGRTEAAAIAREQGLLD